MLSADWKMPQSLGVWHARRPRRPRRPRRRSSSRPRARASRSTRTSSRSSSSRRRPTASRSTTSSSCRRTSSPARSGRRSSSCTAARCGRCCSATTTCSSTTGRTPSISGSRAQGYVVMSVNYRSGVGYGRSFRNAPNTGAARQRRVPGRRRRREVPAVARRRRSGARRHLGPVLRRPADVAGARAQLRHLQGRASTWPACTSGAARSIRRPCRTSRRRIGAIDGWKSPVLLVHGDDDRNVAFPQTTGLVQLLRAARRLLRADRVPGRHARVAAAQPLDVHARPDGHVPEAVPEARTEDRGGIDSIGSALRVGEATKRAARDLSCRPL